MSGRAIFYLVDWLPPDFGAVGQYALLFATEMASVGESVVLIGLTTGPSRTEVAEFESGGRMEIRRLTAVAADKAHYLSRLLWALRANRRLIAGYLAHPEARGAEVIFTGSPPFMLFFAVVAKRLRRARLRYRITDFYPEVIIAARGKASLCLNLLWRATWRMRRQVDRFEALGEDQRSILLAGDIPPERVIIKRDLPPAVITGYEEPCPVPRELERHFVLLYSGNFGVAHEVETVVAGYRRHYREGTGRFALWLNASGENADLVERRLRSEGLIFVRSRPGPLSALPSLMAAADAHLITLKDAFAGYVLPSKVYACVASRRPIVFVGPEISDVHLLCGTSGKASYAHVKPGDVAAFATALERFADERETRAGFRYRGGQERVSQ